MRRRITFRALVVGLALLIAFEGSALAESYTAPTNLSISRSPRGPVENGTVITIRGRLFSPKKACRRGKRVQLVKVGKGVVATTRTNFRGKYRFDRRIFRTQKFRTRFRGTVKGVHPNIKTCLASRSRRIKVRVV